MSTQATARLEIIENEEAFLALEPSWDGLLARSAIRTPFLTWDWVSLWWSQYRAQAQLCVGVARDAQGEPVAIAPLCVLRPEAGPRRMLRHLTFLGGLGNIASEGLDFIVPAGQEASLSLLLCQVFARTSFPWDVIDLPAIRESSPNLGILENCLRAFDQAGPRNPPNTSHILQLPATWDAYLASLSGNRRNDFRSKWKKMTQAHRGRALQAGTDVPVEQAVDALFDLHAMRFTPEQSSFLAGDARHFHRQLARRWIGSRRMMISLLEVEGRFAAVRHGFVFDQRYWDFQSGFDETHAALSIGNLNLGWTVQNAIARGLREYDHLTGDQPYKRAWSTRVRHLHHLEAFNPRSAAAMLFRLMRSAKRMTSRANVEVAA